MFFFTQSLDCTAETVQSTPECITAETAVMSHRLTVHTQLNAERHHQDPRTNNGLDKSCVHVLRNGISPKKEIISFFSQRFQFLTVCFLDAILKKHSQTECAHEKYTYTEYLVDFEICTELVLLREIEFLYVVSL